jgi:hypothetical protein
MVHEREPSVRRKVLKDGSLLAHQMAAGGPSGLKEAPPVLFEPLRGDRGGE